MRTLSIGLLGFGQIAQAVHLPVLSRLPGVAVAAVADAGDERRARARSLLPGAHVDDRYEGVLERPGLDAVVVCLPTGLHAGAAAEAFARGLDVYVEKPVAADPDGARRVLDAWRQSERVGMVGFNYRFNPLFESLGAHLKAGVAGDPVAVRTVFSCAARRQPDWKRERAAGGGVLLDLASHHVDLVRHLFGREVREAFASVESRGSGQDTATVHLRLDGGPTVESLFSCCSVDEDRVEIYGTRGKLSVSRYTSLAVRVDGPDAGGARRDAARHLLASAKRSRHLLDKLRAAGNDPSYAIALTRFVEAVRSRASVAPDVLDGFRSFEVVHAAETSARTGRWVEVAAPEVERAGSTSR